MAHQFATGATAPQRTRIEHAAISLLSGLKKANGGYLVDVLPTAFTVQTARSENDIAQFVATMSRAPVIAVHTADRVDRPGAIGGFSTMAEIDLLVYHSSNNMRNQQIGRMEIDTAGLASDTADPGLHVAMEHARELLLGQMAAATGQDVKQVRPHSEVEIVTDPAITIWLQTYKVTVMTQLDQYRTVQQLLTSIRFRASSNLSEAHLPAAKTDSTTFDVNEDSL